MIKFQQDDLFLITGASSGLGRAISHTIIELGGTVIGVGRNLEELKATKEASSNQEAFYIEQKDLTDDMDALPAWISELVSKYGALSGLVHSAGVQETLPLQSIKIEKAKKLFDINYFSGLAVIKGFAKKKNNIGAGASIVIISSFVSQIGVPGLINYSSSKGAVNSMVKTMAIELARSGIRINAVLPGHVETSLTSSAKTALSKTFYDSLKPKYPLGLGRTEDVANLTCFLLSDKSRWISGDNIIIDGGASLNF